MVVLLVGTPTQTVAINSSPSNAKITITDELGINAFSGTTPAVATLEKHNGSYFGGKRYNVKIEKSGYQPQYITITAQPNGWFIIGNFFFGGLIGWLIIDPFNGGMYTLKPEVANANLSKTSAKLAANMTQLNICLLEDVPEHLRGQLQPINQVTTK